MINPSFPICNRCENVVVLEKGPSCLPHFEYRCDECEIGTHADFGFLWSEEEARKAWEIVNKSITKQ